VERALVFARTKHGSDKVVKNLASKGIEAAAIHGNKSQNARQRALTRFADGEIRVLIATDIAARGIDIKGISHVIQYDLPEVPETYVHRIGRTARAEASGIAIALCSAGERHLLRQIEKVTKLTVPVAEGSVVHTDEEIAQAKAATAEQRRPQNRRRSGTPSGKPKTGQAKPGKRPAKSKPAQSEGKAPAKNQRRKTPGRARTKKAGAST